MSTLKANGNLFLASSLCDGVEDKNIKQVTTLLLNKEANPNILIPTYGVTPFHLVIGNDSEAFAEEVSKLFLRHGGNPNVRSVDGLTPVHVAAAWGRVTVLELLLANGGDPLCLDDEGRSPFHYAFEGKYYKAIVMLGNYCDSTTKYQEEKSIKYKLTFDKLLINDGNVIAEYISDIEGENIINEHAFKNEDERFINIDYLNSCNFINNDVNNENQTDISAKELEIHQEMVKEKFLVNEIINQLSNTLKSSTKNEQSNEECRGHKKSQRSKSPSSMDSSIGDSTLHNMKDKIALKMKPRKLSVTPKYRRKISGHNVKVSLIPVYSANDSIILSKSPNFLSNNLVEKEQRYFSPKTLGKELRVKAFTPCTTRDRSFRSEEFYLGKEVARSTPRRRFRRQYSSLKKFRKKIELSSPENTSSSDSINSLPPNQHSPKKSNYKFEKDLAIKLLDKFVLDDKVDSEVNYSINTSSEENASSLPSSFKSSTSYISVQEEYKYEDIVEGVAFLERRNYILPSSCNRADSKSPNKLWPKLLNLPANKNSADEALRHKLLQLGDNPGPITNTTRQLYLKRLINLEKTVGNLSSSEINRNSKSLLETDNYKECLDNPFLKYGNWINDLRRYKIIENNIFKEFSFTNPSRKWREGISKTSFNYLLLDPRISKDLPHDTENLTECTIWTRFISAIFYVGKGTSSRPYSHLKDAFDAWVSNRNPENAKIRHILNIWNSGNGVICTFAFHNRIPVEAYTREAAMIDALGIQNLENIKSGDYYGIAATWSKEEKRCFGRYLLYQTMKIFVSEGERQIFPQHL